MHSIMLLAELLPNLNQLQIRLRKLKWSYDFMMQNVATFMNKKVIRIK